MVDQFRRVTYDASGAMQIGAAVTPSTNLVQELRSSSTPVRSKFDRQTKRDEWIWQQILRFDVEVCAEEYERRITHRPLRLVRDDDLPPVTLELLDAQYDHPPTKESAIGSEIVYTFLAKEGISGSSETPVASGVFMRDRIHAALLEQADLGVYHPVSYDQDSGLPEINAGVQVPARSKLANEVRSRFTQATRRRLDYALERSSWTWELILLFDREVTIEPFERAIRSSLPVVPRLGDLPQATLFLERVEYAHPPTQGAARGTRVLLAFEAQLSPI